MLTEFDELVRKRSQLKNWWALGNKVAKYDQKRHSLRVDVQPVGMVAFCGQEYAGARNYHEAPAFFRDAVKRELQAESKRLARQAYEKELAHLDSEISKHRDAVLRQLAMEDEGGE